MTTQDIIKKTIPDIKKKCTESNIMHVSNLPTNINICEFQTKIERSLSIKCSFSYSSAINATLQGKLLKVKTIKDGYIITAIHNFNVDVLDTDENLNHSFIVSNLVNSGDYKYILELEHIFKDQFVQINSSEIIITTINEIFSVSGNNIFHQCSDSNPRIITDELDSETFMCSVSNNDIISKPIIFDFETLFYNCSNISKFIQINILKYTHKHIKDSLLYTNDNLNNSTDTYFEVKPNSTRKFAISQKDTLDPGQWRYVVVMNSLNIINN